MSDEYLIRTTRMPQGGYMTDFISHNGREVIRSDLERAIERIVDSSESSSIELMSGNSKVNCVEVKVYGETIK